MHFRLPAGATIIAHFASRLASVSVQTIKMRNPHRILGEWRRTIQSPTNLNFLWSAGHGPEFTGARTLLNSYPQTADTPLPGLTAAALLQPPSPAITMTLRLTGQGDLPGQPGAVK